MFVPIFLVRRFTRRLTVPGLQEGTHMTVIEWVNHASFIVRSDGTSLWCDPWLFGPAFNDGWELLAPSEHGAADIADVDALWFSHVHPDHFAPRVLKAVPKDVRRTTPV